MSAYVYIERLSDMLTEQWPDAPIAYQRPDRLPAAQQALWDWLHPKPLSAWLAPFEAMDGDAAIFLGVTDDILVAVSSFVDGEIKDSALIQKVRPEGGYMHRTYWIGQDKPLDAAWLSGAYSSLEARAQRFIPKNLRAFHEIDLAEGISHVGMGANGAGTFVWMHYGAVIAPYEQRILKLSLKDRWEKLVNQADAHGLPIDRDLEIFAHTPLGDISPRDFRDVFNTQSGLRQQTLKALLIGDTAFLRKPDHYFRRTQILPSQYADPFASGLQFDTIDTNFQAHLSAVTKRALTP